MRASFAILILLAPALAGCTAPPPAGFPDAYLAGNHGIPSGYHRSGPDSRTLGMYGQMSRDGENPLFLRHPAENPMRVNTIDFRLKSGLLGPWEGNGSVRPLEAHAEFIESQATHGEGYADILFLDMAVRFHSPEEATRVAMARTSDYGFYCGSGAFRAHALQDGAVVASVTMLGRPGAESNATMDALFDAMHADLGGTILC